VGEKGNGLGEVLSKNADPTGSLAKFLDSSDKLGGAGKLDGVGGLDGEAKLDGGLGRLDGGLGGLEKSAGDSLPGDAITDGRPAERGPTDSAR
jgi:hypothetical protein